MSDDEQKELDRINREVREWLMGRTPEPQSSLGVDDGDRVMWTRQFSQTVEEADCLELAESLRILDAQRMVVAHTVHERITSRCDGQVWSIDVGMSRAYGGRVQVLEIVDGRVPRVDLQEVATELYGLGLGAHLEDGVATYEFFGFCKRTVHHGQ